MIHVQILVSVTSSKGRFIAGKRRAYTKISPAVKREDGVGDNPGAS
jgi:hypothetical protein